LIYLEDSEQEDTTFNTNQSSELSNSFRKQICN